MDYKQYEKMLNVINNKAPIESGVQALVFMLLYEMFENVDHDLVIIDNMRKTTRFTAYSGVADIAAVSEDFGFNTDKGSIKLCIEIKTIGVNINKYQIGEKLDNYQKQILGQLLTFEKVIWTNGVKWFYYDTIDQNKNGFEALKQDAFYATNNTRIIAQLESVRINKNSDKIKILQKETDSKIASIEDPDDKKLISELLTPKWEYDLRCDEAPVIHIAPSKYADLTKSLSSVIKKL